MKEVESNKNSDTKDIIISNLETRNANIVEKTERNQEMINKEAIIIGGLRADLEHATLELEARNATITELRLLEAAAEANRDIERKGGRCPSSWRAGPGQTSSQPDCPFRRRTCSPTKRP